MRNALSRLTVGRQSTLTQDDGDDNKPYLWTPGVVLEDGRLTWDRMRHLGTAAACRTATTCHTSAAPKQTYPVANSKQPAEPYVAPSTSVEHV